MITTKISADQIAMYDAVDAATNDAVETGTHNATFFPTQKSASDAVDSLALGEAHASTFEVVLDVVFNTAWQPVLHAVNAALNRMRSNL